MNTTKVTNRPLDRDFYNRYRGYVDLPWLADNWQDFRTELRCQLPPAPPLTAIDQRLLWQAASALRIGSRLLDPEHGLRSDSRELPANTLHSAALQLMLTGTIKQLGHWEQILPSGLSPDSLLSCLHHYLIDELKDFRQAIKQSGDHENCFYLLDSESRTVSFSAQGMISEGIACTITFHEAVWAAFLWWILVSEWCWDRLQME